MKKEKKMPKSQKDESKMASKEKEYEKTPNGIPAEILPFKK